MNLEKLQTLVQQTRRDILRMVHAVNSGHPGGSLGTVEFFVTLYNEILEYDPQNFSMDGKGEDLFFLSNGHISPVYYSTLARSGYFPVEELKTFRLLNSRLQGHPTNHDHLPGIRISTGSLGQGLSVAIGAALAKKLNNDDKTVFVLTGDGELQEGQIWEALMYAGSKKVDNIIATIDYNHRQIDGDTTDVMDLGDVKAKLEAFQWEVLEIEKGNDLSSVYEGLLKAKSLTKKQKPVAVILHTEMGNGVSYMMGTHAWHGKAPNDEQLKQGLDENSEMEITDY